jgi:hypothetical protein
MCVQKIPKSAFFILKAPLIQYGCQKTIAGTQCIELNMKFRVKLLN